MRKEGRERREGWGEGTGGEKKKGEDRHTRDGHFPVQMVQSRTIDSDWEGKGGGG